VADVIDGKEEEDNAAKPTEVELKVEKQESGKSVQSTTSEAEKAKQTWCKRHCFCRNQYVFFVALLTCSEWGDRSQVSAIALAPQYGYAPIVLGGAMAHVGCIIVALAAGKLIKKCMHDSILGIIGGLLFLVFGTLELVN
jgi:putative Ca2+/H+ antiporter (TMEM165/GDT1 family)